MYDKYDFSIFSTGNFVFQPSLLCCFISLSFLRS